MLEGNGAAIFAPCSMMVISWTSAWVQFCVLWNGWQRSYWYSNDCYVWLLLISTSHHHFPKWCNCLWHFVVWIGKIISLLRMTRFGLLTTFPQFPFYYVLLDVLWWTSVVYDHPLQNNKVYSFLSAFQCIRGMLTFYLLLPHLLPPCSPRYAHWLFLHVPNVIKLNRGSLLISFSISLGFTPVLVLVPIENKPYNLKRRK